MNSSNMCGDWDFDSNDKWPEGCGWRGAASVISGVAWLCFNIIWLFFYAGDYTVWENIGVFLLSIVALLGFNALAWVGYGLSMAKDHQELPRYRIIGSMLVLGAGIVITTDLVVLPGGRVQCLSEHRRPDGHGAAHIGFVRGAVDRIRRKEVVSTRA